MHFVFDMETAVVKVKKQSPQCAPPQGAFGLYIGREKNRQFSGDPGDPPKMDIFGGSPLVTPKIFRNFFDQPIFLAKTS